MTDQPEHTPPTDEQLTQLLRRVSLPNASRQRHLEMISAQATGMDRTSRRSHLLEVGLLAVLVIAVLAIAVWQLEPGGSGSSSGSPNPDNTQAIATEEPATAEVSPTPSPRLPGGASEHDAVATAIAQNCQMIPLAEEVPPLLRSFNQQFTDWMSINGIWVSPPAYFGGSWHAGPAIDTAWYSEESGPFSATAHSLTNPSLSFSFDDTQSITGSFDPSIYVALTEFPEPGCWEIDATIGDRQATFTVNVLPFEARTDVQLFVNVRQAMIPYPTPATCNANQWTGPEIRESFGIYYWIDNGGIAMRDLSGVFFEGEEELVVQKLGDTRPEIVAWTGGAQFDEAGQYINFELSQTAGQGGDAWVAKGFFPVSGCWHVNVKIEDQEFTATIYVYPAACRLEEGPVSGDIFAGREVERPAGCVEE